MVLKNNRKTLSWILVAILLILSARLYASPPTWHIVPKNSTISFTAIQNDAPVKGAFKSFEGDILFDANELNQSQALITIDTKSVTASYKELVEALKMADLLAVNDFPQAVFKVDNFTKEKEGVYFARGMLTIRDKTAPITVRFEISGDQNKEMKAKGSTTIKRLIFGVGQGEWADTKEVKDDVKVDFDLDLKR